MDFNWSSFSTGAMTAALSLGSSLQSLPSVAGGGLQAVSHSATNVLATVPQALPGVVAAGAMGSAQLATDLSVVERPAKLIASNVPRNSLLLRGVGFLSKALPIISIGAGALAGAKIVTDQGARGLVASKQGRGAVLGAVGGALLLVPHPGAQLAAAGVLGISAVNHFGGMDRLNRFANAPASPSPPNAPAAAAPAMTAPRVA